MNQYEGLNKFIHFVESDMHVKIHIKDYVGFIFVERQLNDTLRDSLIHSNPFCMYIKSDEKAYLKCTRMQKSCLARFERDPSTFVGICHAGVKEYVCPIWHEERLIGAIHAGDFPADPRYAQRYVQRACRHHALDCEKAYALYRQNLHEENVDEERLVVYLEMIAMAFSAIFARMRAHGEYDLTRTTTSIAHNSVISDALEYLNQHYQEDLHVTDIAAYCHCSVSCLSHLFNSYVGTSIPLYITKLRMDHAQNELIDTSVPISVVAERVGFSDPNYFSRVFTRCVGLTPTQFRKSLHQNAK